MDSNKKKPDYEGIYPFWDDLTAAEQRRFADATVVKSYKKGELVHQPDVKCEGMLYILEGTLRIYLLSEDGREITLYRLEKGEICVLSASCVKLPKVTMLPTVRSASGSAGASAKTACVPSSSAAVSSAAIRCLIMFFVFMFSSLSE